MLHQAKGRQGQGGAEAGQDQGEEEEDKDGGGAGGEAGEGSHTDCPRLTLDGLATAAFTRGTGR